MDTNFIQTVEEIEERRLAVVSDFIIYAWVGKISKELLGIVIKPIAVNDSNLKERRIDFHDIDRMIKILEGMSTTKRG